MLSTILSSSSACANVLSSSENPCSSLLPSTQLSYRNWLDTLTNRPIQYANHQIRPNFPIASFNSLETDLLEAFNNLDEDIEWSEINNELTSEAAINKAFL